MFSPIHDIHQTYHRFRIRGCHFIPNIEWVQRENCSQDRLSTSIVVSSYDLLMTLLQDYSVLKLDMNAACVADPALIVMPGTEQDRAVTSL